MYLLGFMKDKIKSCIEYKLTRYKFENDILKLNRSSFPLYLRYIDAGIAFELISSMRCFAWDV